MNPTILASAAKVIPEADLLVNVVRLRVRQLVRGHRPLISVPPGMGLADVALSEIAANKLTSEAIVPTVPEVPAAIISFPTTTPRKKAA